MLKLLLIEEFFFVRILCIFDYLRVLYYYRDIFPEWTDISRSRSLQEEHCPYTAAQYLWFAPVLLPSLSQIALTSGRWREISSTSLADQK